MNLTPEQLKQNAAAMIALAEGKPIQFRPLCVLKDWHNYDPVDASAPNWQDFEYRPAPDPIAPGHNPDKLTVSQVGEGWRLLDASEYGVHPRPWWSSVPEYWPSWGGWERTAGWGGMDGNRSYRTRLSREEFAALDKPVWKMPEPPAGQKWHRDDFTEADLPEGWRPLMEHEKYICGEDDIWMDCTWERFNHDGNIGSAGYSAKARTRRPLPSVPVMAPWDCPEDVPGPVCWIRLPHLPNEQSMVIGVGAEGVDYFGDTSKSVTRDSWADLKEEGTEYSTDRKTWTPCTKPAKS